MVMHLIYGACLSLPNPARCIHREMASNTVEGQGNKVCNDPQLQQLGECCPDEDTLYNADDILHQQQIMSPEEEDAWAGKYFSSRKQPQVLRSSATKACSPSLEEQMADFEKVFSESMQMSGNAGDPGGAADDRSIEQQQLLLGENCMHDAYAQLHAQVEQDTISKLRIAMDCIPEGTKVGTVSLNTCAKVEHRTICSC